MARFHPKPKNETRKLAFMKARVAKASKGDLTEGEVPSIDSVLEIKRAALFEELKRELGISVPPKKQDEDEEAGSADGAAEQEARHVKAAPSEFLKMAEELCKNDEALSVLSAVLQVMYGKKLDRDRYEKIEKIKGAKEGGKGSRRERGRDRDDGDAKADQKRLYIQLGRRDGYNAREIADYFSDMLHIPGKMVDRIDVTTSFSLVSLPVAEADRMLSLAEHDSTIPHIHVDTKAAGPRRRRSAEREGRGGREERAFGGGHEGFGRSRRESGRKSKARANVHTPTERSGSSSYKKSKKAREL